MNQYKNTRKAQIQKGLIEVDVQLDPETAGIVSESLLAYPIGGNYAQIASIPFFAEEIGIDDIVETEISGEHERKFVGVVKKNTNTFCVTFDVQESDFALGQTVSEYLLSKGIRSDSAGIGIFIIAVPVYVDNKVLDVILRDCTVVLKKVLSV